MSVTAVFNNQSPSATVTATSEDPSRLLLSIDEKSPGSATITFSLPGGSDFQTGYFFAQALAGSGEVGIKITVAGFPELRTTIPLYEVGLKLIDNYGIPTLISGSDTSARVIVFASVLQPPNQIPLLPTGNAIRAGRGDLTVPIVFSQSGIAESDPASAVIKTGESSTIVIIRPLNTGSTEISLGGVPGFQILPPTIPIKVDALRLQPSLGASFLNSRSVLPYRLLTLGQVSVNSQARLPFDVRVESLNPSLVKLTASPDNAPTDAITLIGYSPNNPARFYAAALQLSGETQIRFSAAGMEPVVLNVSLTPLALSIEPNNITQYLNQGPISITVSAGGNGATLPSGTTIPLTIVNTNPGVVDVDAATVELRESLTTRFTVTPKRAGTTSLVITGQTGTSANASIAILEPTAGLYIPGRFTIGQYSQKSILLNFTGNQPPNGLVVKITSRNPSALVVSGVADTAGSSEVIIPVRTGQPLPSVYLQGLSNSGSTIVVVSAPGFASTEYTVSLSASGIAAVSPPSESALRVGQPGRVGYSLCEMLPGPGQTTYCGLTRAAPQAPNITVDVTSSDPTVMEITEPKATLTAANQDKWSFGVKVLRTGVVRIRITANPLNANNAGEHVFSIFP